jgi:pantetheine-phosphate adenylyltransferase
LSLFGITEGKKMSKIAVYPGTFDPITNGHLDLIERALTMFDQVIVAVAANKDKKPLFDLSQRVALIEQVVADKPHVSVQSFDNLLTDFLRASDSRIVIRGLRAVSDFEYEFMLAGMNRKLMPEIESVYLMPSEQYMFISSTFVREVARLHGDVSAFVPPPVLAAFNRR